MSRHHPASPDYYRCRAMGGMVVFDPTTIAIMTAVSTGMQVIGAISNAQAQSASLKSQAAAEEANAQILRDNAAQANREASSQEDILRARQRVIRGAQVAAIAQSGIGFEGTGNDLLEQSDINATLDDLSVRYEGEMKARSLTTQAGFSTFNAAMARSNASAVKTAGYLSAAGAAASGASSYYQFQKQYGASSASLTPSYSTGPGTGKIY